jgi:hypothetical protein
MIQAGGSDQERLKWGFKLVAARSPTSGEVADLLQLLAAERGEFSAAAARASALVRLGESPVPANIDAVELAAWTVVSNLLLNLDEVMSRE